MRIAASPAIRACLGGFEPTAEQWAAIAYEPVPVAIVAGAGSGKTAIMAARIVWMTEEGLVRPAQILGLTFTTKAAGELEERVARAFAAMDPIPPEQPSVATYNSFADRLVREHGVRIGIDPDVGLLSPAQQWQLLLGEFDRLPPFEAIDSRSMASICRAALGLSDQCANHLVTPQRVAEEDGRILNEANRFADDVVRASRRRIELARVVEAYLAAKHRTRRIDFGDQVTKAVEILERFPDVAEELSRRYPALLLDEYQDTNVAQRRLLQLVAPTGHNVTAVGDARQNIYQWRGSTLFNLIDFPKRHFLRSGSEPHDYLSLSENFRCGARILAVANRIVEHVPAERRPGNPLHAHPANGDGWVGVKLAADQHEEAAFIAEEIRRLHGEPACPGRPPTVWSDFAILVRRRSHIGRLYSELRARDIPVEVIGLGGLLHVPEVLDTVAWLRVLADPGPPGNRWLARILLGPRFRIHYRDLALLARWAAHHTRELAEAKRSRFAPEETEAQEDGTGGPAGPGAGAGARPIVPDETDFEPDDVAYSLAEALDHLEEIEGLGPEAMRRLLRAKRELDELRPATTGPLLELVRTVMDVTGIVESVESTAREGAGAARANLTNFLGVVAAFAPLEGEASLGAFLAYLDAAEEVEDTLDLATVVVSDSVKLLTVHKAKGLEFEVVFVPGVAARDNGKGDRVDSIFPDERTSNPMTSHANLPYGAREDADHLPSPWRAGGPGVKDAGTPKPRAEFARELKERAVEDERRLFYVALTRAKQRLYVTAAWWYERQEQQRGPSIFFDEVRQVPETEELPPAELPAESPLKAKLKKRAVWPPDPPHRLRPDELFPESYLIVLERLRAGEIDPGVLLERVHPDARGDVLAGVASFRRIIANLHDAAGRAAGRFPGGPHRPDGRDALPASLSATQLVDLLGGAARPKDFSRPLPERPSDARRIGSEIHRWIEEQARGLTGLAEEDTLDSPGLHIETSRLSELKATFVRMGYAERTLARLDSGEPMAELPFVLKVGDRLVRGRIDAVYELPDGGLEIVDFKTGGEVERPGLDQLGIYAAALALLGVAPAGSLTLTYCYLAHGRTESRTMASAEASATLGAMTDRLSRLV
jgi:ATP-dependent DNA helicase UvrD/PcrA